MSVSPTIFMQKALQVAAEGLQNGELPIGAVVVLNDQIIAPISLTNHSRIVYSREEKERSTQREMAGKKTFLPDRALEAAMNLFWKQGYEGCSIEDIVQTTGLGRGSLYDTFGDKHALYVAALNRYLTGASEGLAAYEQSERPLKETLGSYFQHWIDSLLSDPDRRGCFLVNAIIEMAPHDSEVKHITQSASQAQEEMFYRLLITAQVRGELDWTSDPHQIAHFLLGILISIRVLARARQDRKILQDVVETALAILH